MSLKENLMEELSKLRLARERPLIKQVKGQRGKDNKLKEEAAKLLAEVEGED